MLGPILPQLVPPPSSSTPLLATLKWRGSCSSFDKIKKNPATEYGVESRVADPGLSFGSGFYRVSDPFPGFWESDSSVFILHGSGIDCFPAGQIRIRRPGCEYGLSCLVKGPELGGPHHLYSLYHFGLINLNFLKSLSSRFKYSFFLIYCPNYRLC